MHGSGDLPGLAEVLRYDFIKPTPRKKITNKERAEIFLRAEGNCHLCGMTIRPGEDWDVSHPETGLWAGGSDDRAVLKPAHRKCHKRHTAGETTQRAKEARVQQKYIGAFQKTGRPMPGSKRSKFKRKVNGRTVLRGEPES
jgi:5-methylcytosine-specific restriction enzyme A